MKVKIYKRVLGLITLFAVSFGLSACGSPKQAGVVGGKTGLIQNPTINQNQNSMMPAPRTRMS